MRFKLKLPENRKIIIFDDEGYNPKEINKIINLEECFLLKVRKKNIKEIYINPKILFYTLFYILVKKQKISVAYFSSIILMIRPKLVLTRNDNLISFSLTAKNLEKKFKFLAIQKAARYEYGEPFYDKKNKKKIYIPEFACFGEVEKNIAKKHNLKIKKFFVCGSLKLAHLIEENKIRNEKEKSFDICLISESSTGWNKLYPGFEEAIGKIAHYTSKFAIENNKKLIIAGKRKTSHFNQIEKQFYKKYLIGDFEIQLNNGWNSYELSSKSRLTIGAVSTLLRETLSLKNKILSFNFFNHDAWNFPINGICNFKDANYSEFKKRLEEILSLNFEEYEKKLSKNISYLMNTDLNYLTTKKLKNRISEIVN